MAGEWIKFEASTPEKREVFSITAAMGWTDPDLTVGKLLKVWRWFDQQTVGGNADGVTLVLLDSIIGVSGFAQAMCNVGWLVADEKGVSLPNFDRHNGKTAKERALTAKRVAKHKGNGNGNAKGNADTVTGALPKEEKSREEENKTLVAAATEDRLDGQESEVSGKAKREPSSEDHGAARWLYKVQQKVTPKMRSPNLQRWAEDIRLMREVDRRTHREICELFQWAKSDAFWSPNCQCPAKLREKWDQLTEKRTRGSTQAPPRQTFEDVI